MHSFCVVSDIYSTSKINLLAVIMFSPSRDRKGSCFKHSKLKWKVKVLCLDSCSDFGLLFKPYKMFLAL